MIQSDVFIAKFGLIHGRLMTSLENERVLISQGLSLADQALTQIRTLEALRESSLSDRETLMGLQRSLLISEQEVEKARRKCARLEAEHSKTRIQSSIAANEIARLTTIAEQLSLSASKTIQTENPASSIGQDPPIPFISTLDKHDKFVTNRNTSAGQDQSEYRKWLAERTKQNQTMSQICSTKELSCGGLQPRESLTSVELHKLGHLSRIDVETIARQPRETSVDLYQQLRSRTMSREPSSDKSVNQIKSAFETLSAEQSCHTSSKHSEYICAILPRQFTGSMKMDGPADLITNDLSRNGILISHPFSSGGRTSAGIEGSRRLCEDKWDTERTKHHERLHRSLSRIDNETLKLQKRVKEGTLKGKNWSG
jgi:hypothetical protein